MSKEVRLEKLRRSLANEVDETDWEWSFASEIVIISKEMSVDTDKIMEWTIMKYDVVRKAIAEYFEKQSESIKQTSGSAITLGS